ncbi:hypothetical protein MSS2_02454 [Mycobacterium marinum]|nr:hypothetical protein MSS2_02454 [Mycobacterium marinum]
MRRADALNLRDQLLAQVGNLIHPLPELLKVRLDSGGGLTLPILKRPESLGGIQQRLLISGPCGGKRIKRSALIRLGDLRGRRADRVVRGSRGHRARGSKKTRTHPAKTSASTEGVRTQHTARRHRRHRAAPSVQRLFHLFIGADIRLGRLPKSISKLLSSLISRIDISQHRVGREHQIRSRVNDHRKRTQRLETRRRRRDQRLQLGSPAHQLLGNHLHINRLGHIALSLSRRGRRLQLGSPAHQLLGNHLHINRLGHIALSLSRRGQDEPE